MTIRRIKTGLRWRVRALIKKCADCLEYLKYYLLYPFAALYRSRDIWIVAERGTDARDNGFHMFRYLRENDPSRAVYYIISADSADRKNVEPYGNIIDYGSLKHYLFFIAAKVHISTHVMGTSPDRSFYTHKRSRIRLPGKTVFLQHGVIQCNLKQLYADKTRLDLFICGAAPEYDYVKATFGYRNNEVRYTGLARYDQLHDFETKKQILIMPTWRKSLRARRASGDAPADSVFVRRWNALLKNEKLLNAAERAGVTILFYPHIELQRDPDLFSSPDPRVIIADFAHYDVQTLLKESALLITDYSSVHFDFGYMKKPVVYYQFDPEDFYSRHYAPGYFDHRTMGFGEVTDDEAALVDLVIDAMENGFSAKEPYRQRCEAFFPLHDKNNCRRIYQEILRLDS
ncbi:MAG: CDP-glycerol glycerophosphotransferase family protein [Clostridia bacterium]|nr:CDP-glycerol glycerophosphotransferase family protein [Clostridia bacterium]